MDIITVGFIGAGDISLLHAEGIKACPNARLKGLWNITPELANEKSALFDCMIYDSAEALVNDPEIDAVFVLTALEAHHTYVMMAIEAGKHVFVEKPVGVTIQEIEEMRDGAEKAGVICMPGHNYIYEPSVRRAKGLIESGQLGDLVSFYIMYNIEHPESVAKRLPGVIRQIATHHAYILLYLAGLPKSISAMKSTIHYEHITQEDLAMVLLKMESGAIGHFCASFASDDHAGDPWTFMIKVIGTKGATRYSYRDWVENTPATVHSQTYSAYPFTIAEIDRYFIQDCILQGKKPLSTLDDAIMAQKIIEGIEASVEERREVDI